MYWVKPTFGAAVTAKFGALVQMELQMLGRDSTNFMVVATEAQKTGSNQKKN